MEFIWIGVAFVFALAMKSLSLPPLIGFLMAGFALNFAGVTPDPSLQTLADLGITIMLFTIGLKLNVNQLIKPEVWAGTIATTGGWTLLFGSFSLLYMSLGLAYFELLDWKTAFILGFAFSFSSTVCVVKMLESSGEMKTRHGNLAISILVMQDIAAVLFLVAATGKVPSIWALGLVGLYFVRPYLGKLLSKAGHNEMLPLTGFFIALGGYELFTLVGMKGDLGALVAGFLLSSHVKSTELAKSLLNFKDLFLIGFFLSIGFVALPTVDMLLMSLFICILLPVKFLLFFVTFAKLRLRARTAYLSSLILTNFSEFGLIVVALVVGNGWLDKDWLVILAMSVSMSFVFTSIVYKVAHQIYSKRKELIKKFERSPCLPQDVYLQPEHANTLVIGLGRVGCGTYNALHNAIGDKVWGIDSDQDRINEQQEKGMQVMFGDAEDIDLWENMKLDNIKLILLALPSIDDCAIIVQQLRSAQFKGNIAAIARFEDERRKLEHIGVDHVFNFYVEAGSGFAEESLKLLKAAEA
jgi:predicted Kef-type K+ transport protein